MKSPKTQPITNPSGIITPVWSAFFDQQDKVVVKDGTATDTRAKADDRFIVLDGSSNTVTFKLPADQRPNQRIPETGTEFYVFCRDDSNTCTIDLNGSTFYSASGPLTMIEGEGYYFKFDGTKWVGFQMFSGSGIINHNDLNNIQGGNGVDEYYHLTLTDHTEAVSFLDGGTGTHTAIDSHIADNTIHFTEASIDHTAIQNIGTNTHAQIDTHIANDEIHNEPFDQITSTFTGNNETNRAFLEASSPVVDYDMTYNSDGDPLTMTDGVNTWTLSYDTTGKFSGMVKT